MAFCLNRTTCIGNVGKEPRLLTENKRPIYKFSVGVNNTYKKSGTLVTKTTWYQCTAWGDQATLYAKMLKTGDLIYVEGTMENFDWQNQRTGEKHHEMGLTVTRAIKLAKDTQVTGSRQEPAQQSAFEQQTTEQVDFDQDENDLPF